MKTSHQIGHDAESEAAQYLRSLGYKVLDLNWRTPRCEIDIVAQKDLRIYFVEVKYRRVASQGTGLDYITPRKLRQMQLAAELWVQEHQWNGDYQLAALSIDGGRITFLTDF